MNEQEWRRMCLHFNFECQDPDQPDMQNDTVERIPGPRSMPTWKQTYLLSPSMLKSIQVRNQTWSPDRGNGCICHPWSALRPYWASRYYRGLQNNVSFLVTIIPITPVLGPKYRKYYTIWALKPYYLGPGPLR